MFNLKLNIEISGNNIKDNQRRLNSSFQTNRIYYRIENNGEKLKLQHLLFSCIHNQHSTLITVPH